MKDVWAPGSAEGSPAGEPTGAGPARSEPRATAAEEDAGPLGQLVAAATELTSSTEWVVVSSPANVREGPSSNDAPYNTNGMIFRLWRASQIN